MAFSNDQQNALDLFDAFLADPDQFLFALLGYAGTGKSYTFAEMAQRMYGQAIAAAPTHKAINVVRRNLRASGVDFETGWLKQNHRDGVLITGTTAQLIGLSPVISDTQAEGEKNFSKTSKGILGSVRDSVRFISIDEVSMLSAEHLQLISEAAVANDTKVVIIGDPGQLPPVNAAPIDWASLPTVAVLNQVMRTPEGSAIPLLAQAIRNGDDWRAVRGSGIVHENNPGAAFLDVVTTPAEDERERNVFVAYRNEVVNEVQELAALSVYGHGRNSFAPGEIVISEARFEAEAPTYVEKYRRTLMRPAVVANNADELVVVEFGEKGKWGTEVRMARLDNRDVTFDAEYLTAEERADKRHPWNVATVAAFAKARDLQVQWNAMNGREKGSIAGTNLDSRRVDAWVAAFDLQDRSIINFRHPFASTSHKSQGSTYQNAFVDAQDIERFDARGLYVAATRPAKNLIIG